MTSIKIRQRALSELGRWLKNDPEEWLSIKEKARSHNPWFTLKETDRATNSIVNNLLEEDVLDEWAKRYDLGSSANVKRVGLILAGNIPMVGWHDLQCLYLSGHVGKIKFSSKDDILIPFLLEKLSEFDGQINTQLSKTDKLSDFDAVIATGSNNTGRYFNTYFNSVPNIIRKHRNSIAVLSGNESREALIELGKDIFSYFGLGCRNVTHLYLPEDYDPAELLSIWDSEFSYVSDHHKYRNNYDYNYAIWLLNKEKFMAGTSVLMKNDNSYLARIGSVNYQYYKDINKVSAELEQRANDIQTIVAGTPVGAHSITPPGTAQRPKWDDFADNIDTMEFLVNL